MQNILQTSKNPILLNALPSSRVALTTELFLMLFQIDTNIDFSEFI